MREILFSIFVASTVTWMWVAHGWLRLLRKRLNAHSEVLEAQRRLLEELLRP